MLFDSLLTRALKIVAHRAQLDEEFLDVLGRWSSLVEESRYARWMARAAEIKLDDHLQYAILADSYNYHAFLFWPLFPQVPETAVHDVSLSGRIYADHLIQIDHIIDGDVTDTASTVAQFKADFLYQHSLSILHRYFPADSPFWNEFAKHRSDFSQTVLLERAIQRDEIVQPYDRAAFEQIATGKSAMTKCTVAALAVLAGSTARLAELYRWLDEIAIVAQMFDDLKDWKKDLQKKQLSYLLSQFLSEVGQGQGQDLQLDLESLKRRFYLSDALRSALDETQERLASLLSAPELANCEDLLWVMGLYRDKLNLVAKQVALTRTRVRTLQAVPDADPLSRALAFVRSSQEPTGAWSDFYTTANESTDWVTGYVAQAIQDLRSDRATLDRAAGWLAQRRFPTGGWGYHRGVVQDADSTAACLSFMVNHLSAPDVKRSVQALISFQHPDGGLGTYSDPQGVARVMHVDQTTDFSGWCGPHPCVTATAVLALCACSSHVECSRAVNAAVRYLLDRQRKDGAWNAYWWHSDVYATAQSVRALGLATLCGAENARQDVDAARQRGLAFLLETQHDSGAWGAYFESKDCPFQTALALSALLTDPAPSCVSAARAAASYLLHSQQVNGSWHAAGPIMRLPRPDDKRPWEWPRAVDRGTTLGTLVRDQCRLFTTATVLEALGQVEALGVWPENTS